MDEGGLIDFDDLQLADDELFMDTAAVLESSPSSPAGGLGGGGVMENCSSINLSDDDGSFVLHNVTPLMELQSRSAGSLASPASSVASCSTAGILVDDRRLFSSPCATTAALVDDADRTPTRARTPVDIEDDDDLAEVQHHSIADIFVLDSPNTSPVKFECKLPPVSTEGSVTIPATSASTSIPSCGDVDRNSSPSKLSNTSSGSPTRQFSRLERKPSMLRSPSKHYSAFRARKPINPSSPPPPAPAVIISTSTSSNMDKNLESTISENRMTSLSRQKSRIAKPRKLVDEPSVKPKEPVSRTDKIKSALPRFMQHSKSKK